MDYRDKDENNKKQTRQRKNEKTVWEEMSDSERNIFGGYEDFCRDYKQIRRYVKLLCIPMTFLVIVLAMYIVYMATGFNIFSYIV